MENLNDILSILTTSGGWGVAVLVGFYHWRKDQEHAKERKEWTAFAIESTEILSSLREVIRRCHDRGDRHD